MLRRTIFSLAVLAAGCTVRARVQPAPAYPPPAQPAYAAAPAPAPVVVAPPVMEDRHWLQPDDVFVSDRPLISGDVHVSIAKVLQPPAPERNNEGRFLITKSGRELWTQHFWQSRLAQPGEIGIGTMVIYFGSNTIQGVRAAPRDKNNAFGGMWTLTRVTDLSDLGRGVVRVAGNGQPIALDNLRIVAGPGATAQAAPAAYPPPAAPVAAAAPGPAPVVGPAPVAAPSPVLRATPPTAPGDDAHWLSSDDYFISERPFVRELHLSLAKMLQPPTPQTKNEGQFLATSNGRTLWTAHFWRTRIAQPSELALGSVIVYFGSNHVAGARQAPRDKNNARGGMWTMSTVTSLAELYRNEIRVASQGAPISVNNIRVIVP